VKGKMGFEKFGKINYTAETKVQDFVEHLEKGKIEATQCRACKKVYFPPRMDCSNCLSTDNMNWKEIHNEWTLITYTTAHFAPAGFEEDTPYHLVIAESVEGFKILARLSKDVGENQVKPGMKLKLIPVKLSHDKIVYEFKPLIE
jgi:uncharacterized OB-fold protein